MSLCRSAWRLHVTLPHDASAILLKGVKQQDRHKTEYWKGLASAKTRLWKALNVSLDLASNAGWVGCVVTCLVRCAANCTASGSDRSAQMMPMNPGRLLARQMCCSAIMRRLMRLRSMPSRKPSSCSLGPTIGFSLHSLNPAASASSMGAAQRSPRSHHDAPEASFPYIETGICSKDPSTMFLVVQ